jgi:hypothetical protein
MTNEELQIKMEHIEKDLGEIKTKVTSLPTREQTQLDNEMLVQRVMEACDKRYAPKWTEQAIYFLIFAVVLGYIIVQMMEKLSL